MIPFAVFVPCQSDDEARAIAVKCATTVLGETADEIALRKLVDARWPLVFLDGGKLTLHWVPKRLLVCDVFGRLNRLVGVVEVTDVRFGEENAQDTISVIDGEQQKLFL